MRITLFTVEEASRMAAEIRPLVERLVGMKRRLDRLQSRISVLSLACAGASEANSDSRELRDAAVERKRLADQLQRGIQAIHVRGPVVKDLERGLVDFYSVAADRLIFLCWQFEEPEVAHWHSLEGGFANREPLDRSERG